MSVAPDLAAGQLVGPRLAAPGSGSRLPAAEELLGPGRRLDLLGVWLGSARRVSASPSSCGAARLVARPWSACVGPPLELVGGSRPELPGQSGAALEQTEQDQEEGGGEEEGGETSSGPGVPPSAFIALPHNQGR